MRGISSELQPGLTRKVAPAETDCSNCSAVIINEIISWGYLPLVVYIVAPLFRECGGDVLASHLDTDYQRLTTERASTSTPNRHEQRRTTSDTFCGDLPILQVISNNQERWRTWGIPLKIMVSPVRFRVSPLLDLDLQRNVSGNERSRCSAGRLPHFTSVKCAGPPDRGLS
jgi:hypothetical protein